MAFQRTALKVEAKRLLAAQGPVILGIVIVAFVVQAALGATLVGTLLVSGPLALGWTMVFLTVVRGGEVTLAVLFQGFARFVPALVTWLRLTIVILLWSLLLVVPGIIAALRYSMTWAVLADEPELTSGEAMERSRQLMEGHEGDLWGLVMSFFWWYLFCLVTAGIGILYVGPYVCASVSLFYEGLRAEEAT